jgi:hypothetical protein
MPVNWAFPAAQGEPESFLRILGSIYFCKEFLMAPDFSLLKNFLSAILVNRFLGSTC